MSDIKRVAIVLTELRPGGMERVVAHLSSRLLLRKVQPLVICLGKEGALAPELKAAGVEIVALGSTRGYDLRALSHLANLFKRFRPQVVNVHDYSSLPYAAMACLRRSDCPVVFTAHGLLYDGFERLRRRYRVFSRRVSSLMAVSDQVRDRHVAFLNWRRPTHIVPNGVPDICRQVEVGDQVRKELGIAKDDFVFLAVGNPRPEKAFDILIEACKLVEQRKLGRRFWMLIAGTLSDNEYCRSLQRAAENASVPGLRLLGFRRDVHRLYSAANAFVVSSRSEGLPMVVLEAMTAGLPVLSTRVGGIPDAVPPTCGILVEPDSPEELALQMQKLMFQDEESLTEMGRSAREHALREYSVDTMTDRYLEVFAATVRSRDRGGRR